MTCFDVMKLLVGSIIDRYIYITLYINLIIIYYFFY